MKFKLMFLLVAAQATGEFFSLGNHGFFESEDEALKPVEDGIVNVPAGCAYAAIEVRVPVAEDAAEPAAPKKAAAPKAAAPPPPDENPQ